MQKENKNNFYILNTFKNIIVKLNFWWKVDNKILIEKQHVDISLDRSHRQKLDARVLKILNYSWSNF